MGSLLRHVDNALVSLRLVSVHWYKSPLIRSGLEAIVDAESKHGFLLLAVTYSMAVVAFVLVALCRGTLA